MTARNGQPNERGPQARATTALGNAVGVALWTILVACLFFPLANYVVWPSIATSSRPVIVVYVVAVCTISLLIGRWLAYRVAVRKANP